MRHLACLAATVGIMVSALGCGDDESLSEKVGQSVGESATDFFKAAGKGIDEKLLVDAQLSEAAKQRGLSLSLAKHKGLDEAGAKAITAYLIAEDAFEGRLMAKALTETGTEIGRVVVDVAFGADDAKYVTFDFDDEMDTALVDVYRIDVRE